MELRYKTFSDESELCFWCKKNDVTPKYITAQMITDSRGFPKSRIVVYY